MVVADVAVGGEEEAKLGQKARGFEERNRVCPRKVGDSRPSDL